MRTFSLVNTSFALLFLAALLPAADAQLIPVSQSRSVSASACTDSMSASASGFGLFNTNVMVDFTGNPVDCGEVPPFDGGASQTSVITSSNIIANAGADGYHGQGNSSFNVTFDVPAAAYYTLNGNIDAFGAESVELSGPTGTIFQAVITSPSFSLSGELPAGRYSIVANAAADWPISNSGGFYLDLEFATLSPQISSVTVQTNDVLLTSMTPPGTNLVQATNGAADGSYSNNFAIISPPLIIPGGSNVTIVTTNYLDAGGATNFPSRYYRIAQVFGPTLASDNAADPAYTNGWTNGSNGGTGFGPWTLTASGVIGSISNGYYAGSSTNNAFGSSPGIDTGGGDSWGLYAHGANFTAAYRGFNNSVPLYGTVKLDMDNGFIDTGNADGFVLRTGNVNGSYTNYNTNARFEFLYIGGDSSNSYKVVDAAGLYNIGVPFTGTGLHLVFTLGTNDTYTLLVIDNASGDTNATVNGTLGGTTGSTIDSIALYNRNAGAGAANDAFFNSLQIIGP